MKKCSHCGFPIKINTAAFCPKCGKALKQYEQGEPPIKKKFKQAQVPAGKPSRFFAKLYGICAEKVKKLKGKGTYSSGRAKTGKTKKLDSRHPSTKNSMYENYDGYYEDRPTNDNGQNKDALDPELIKRIILIAVGAVVIVILSAVLLFLL